MSVFAKWLAARRFRRVFCIAGLFLLPLLGLVSSAVIVMSVRTNGPREALLDCLLALALLAGMGWLAGVQDLPSVLVIAAVMWTIWLGLGAVAWKTGSLVLTVQALVILALVGLGFFQSMIGNPVEYWRELVEQMYSSLPVAGADSEQVLVELAPLMAGIIVASILTSSVLVVLLGNALAARVTGDDYGRQFLGLRLGYAIGGLAALAGIATLLGFGLDGALLVLGAAFMFHGIAVAAWWAGQRGWPAGWWIGLCILPVLLLDFLIIEAALFAVLGFVDNWYDLRRAQAPG